MVLQPLIPVTLYRSNLLIIQEVSSFDHIFLETNLK